MMSAWKIPDEDLNAWLDGELPPARHAAVSAWLAYHPDEARRLAAYRADAEAMRRIFGAARRSQPAPANLNRRSFLRVAAAVAGLAVTGGALLSGRVAAKLDPFVEEASAAHAQLLDHVADLSGTPPDRERLSRAMTEHIGEKVELPDTEDLGFRLVAARLFTPLAGPTAQAVYRDRQGQLATLYMRARPGGAEHPVQTYRRGGSNVLFWQDDDFVCVISGVAAADRLEALGNRIYEARES